MTHHAPTDGSWVRELKFHFTHYQTNEVFGVLSIVSLVFFLLLAFFTMAFETISLVFVGLAVASFILLLVVEVVGNIVGFIYEHGLGKAISNLLFVLKGLSFVIPAAIYLYFGGILVGGAFLIVAQFLLPSFLLPFYIAAYLLFSAGWMANGLNFIDRRHHPPPPIGMYNSVKSLYPHQSGS